MAAPKHSEPPAVPSTRPQTFVHDPTTDDPHKMKQVGPEKVDLTGFDDGTFKKKGEPEGSEAYHLKIVENPPDGQTHHLKNQEHYWSGNETQFKDQFDKE